MEAYVACPDFLTLVSFNQNPILLTQSPLRAYRSSFE